MSVAGIECYKHDTACYKCLTFGAKRLDILVHVETVVKKKKKLMNLLKLNVAFAVRCKIILCNGFCHSVFIVVPECCVVTYKSQ